MSFRLSQNSEAKIAPGPSAPAKRTTNWSLIAAAGTLLTSGLLLLSGRRKAGVIAAASGTALAFVGEQKTVSGWWAAIPGAIVELQKLLNQIHGAVQNADEKRQQLGSSFRR